MKTHYSFYLVSVTLLFLAAASQQKPTMLAPVTLLGCPDKCGNVNIPYPFGTKDGCFLAGFQIPFILTEDSLSPVELTSVSVAEGKLQVHAPFCYNCKLNQTYNSSRNYIDISFPYRSPFLLSEESTVLMGIGKDPVRAVQEFGPSCDVTVESFADHVNGTCCSGRGCCQATLLPQTSNNIVTMKSYGYHNGCAYSMLVDKSWYNFTSLDLDGDVFLRKNDARGVPIVVDFVMVNHSCPRPGQQAHDGYACANDNTMCVQVPFYHDTPGYLCRCSQGYQGNPYIQTGCQGTYFYLSFFSCTRICRNCILACPTGTKGNATEGHCSEMFPLPAKVAVGAIGGLFVITLVVFFLLLHRQKRKMKQLYLKNGGPALQKANNIKIYRTEELKPILKCANFIGKGCFGEKPVTDSVAHNEQFANQVIIQSQVIHNNIVRLVGCCLEVDIPMLVYEFLSKGSLDETLHSNNKVPLDLDVRLSIAAESAEGLAYMHSKTGKRILRGHVKPANILLDDDYVPNISDFGISRMIARDKEHTTSKKSDVYSFGVLLFELVSRRKATYSDHNSLVRNFVDAHKTEKIPIGMFDKEFAEPGDLELLGSLARVAVECLNLDVDERPAMTDVVERLLMLKRSRK
ncbi:hypothetical protein VPH35_133672 [Triticum aestivum]